MSPEQMPAEHLVKTTVWKALVRRFNDVHTLHHIGAFAGAPGIGKTTAIQSFAAEHHREVVEVQCWDIGTAPGTFIQYILEAVRAKIGSQDCYVPSGAKLRPALALAVREWSARLQFENPEMRVPRLTVAVDEAQRLTPEAIEGFRPFNDGINGCPKLGLILVGNNGFEVRGRGSFLSAAVTSRASYRITLSAAELTDEDISLVVDARGDFAPEALSSLVATWRSRRPAARDFRKFCKGLDSMVAVAAGGQVDVDLAGSIHSFLDED